MSVQSIYLQPIPILPITLPGGALEVTLILVIGVLIVIAIIIRGITRSRSRGGGDFVVVYNPDGLSTSYTIDPLVPPSLYTYRCQSTELCLLVVRSPPITYQDPRTKSIRRMWIAVEQSGLAMTLSPDELHTISVASEAVGDYNIDDILLLVKSAIEKKTYSEHVKLPGGFRVAFTYKVYPAVTRVLADFLKSDAVALSSILSALRTAREAKTLAEAVAIRREAELKKYMYIGIVVLLILIGLAILMGMRGG